MALPLYSCLYLYLCLLDLVSRGCGGGIGESVRGLVKEAEKAQAALVHQLADHTVCEESNLNEE